MVWMAAQNILKEKDLQYLHNLFIWCIKVMSIFYRLSWFFLISYILPPLNVFSLSTLRTKTTWDCDFRVMLRHASKRILPVSFVVRFLFPLPVKSYYLPKFPFVCLFKAFTVFQIWWNLTGVYCYYKWWCFCTGFNDL